MRWYLSIACSVYWLYIVISYYQSGVAWQSTQSLSLVPYYRVLSNEMVSQYSMQRVLVVYYYWLLSRKSIWQSTLCLSRVSYFQVLSIEIVSQQSMWRLLVVHYYQLLSEEYPGGARSGYHLCLIIMEYYRLNQYLSIACGVYWLYLIIVCYQKSSLVQHVEFITGTVLRVLADELVSQYSMWLLLVVHYYRLLSEESILVEHVVVTTCALLLWSIIG